MHMMRNAKAIHVDFYAYLWCVDFRIEKLKVSALRMYKDEKRHQREVHNGKYHWRVSFF